MAAVRAFLLSMLAVQRHEEKDAFARSFPHPWLIWEPGAWQPAQPGSERVQTHGGAGGAYHPQSMGDALCFELGERRPFKIGRAKGGDIQINDATVSREHLLVEPEPSGTGWLATPTTATNTTELLNGSKLTGTSRPLRPGDQLRMGDVVVTFVDPAALRERLDEQLRKAYQVK